MGEFHNRRPARPPRRAPRKQAPNAERTLWLRLRDQRFLGMAFRRQYRVGPFVLDFYCPEARLGIALDGDIHFVGDAAQRDALRQQWIDGAAIKVVRIMNSDVLEGMDGVLDAIAKAAGRMANDQPAQRTQPKNASPPRVRRSHRPASPGRATKRKTGSR